MNKMKFMKFTTTQTKYANYLPNTNFEISYNNFAQKS